MIERVHTDADIVSIVNARVPLKKRGTEWIGRCPFHDDHDPSLRVHPDRQVWRCSPCDKGGDVITFVEMFNRLSFTAAVDLIATEAGLSADVDMRARDEREPKVVALYEYRDEAGVLRAVKKRWEPAHDRSGKSKSFTWEHPNKTPGQPKPWSPTLYRLPDVISAIGEGQTVYVVEGEKCADALYDRGLVATCNEDGAGKWNGDHATHLLDANVVVLPDNDKVGHEHAQAVAASLLGTARSVGIVDLADEVKPKGDVVDWLAAGHGLNELADRVKAALWDGAMARARLDLATVGLVKRTWDRPVFENAYDLAMEKLPAVEWLVRGLLGQGDVHVIGGDPKAGKTWMEAELAVAVASGTKAFGEFNVAEPGHVAMLFCEDGRKALRNRFRAIAHGRQIPLDRALKRLHLWPRASVDLLNDDDCAGILASCRSLPEMPVLICIDPLRDANSGEENSNDDMRRVMHRARALRDVTGATILIVHHMSKPAKESRNDQRGSLFHRFRGASAIRGAYDGGIAVEGLFKAESTIKAKIEVELRAGRGAGVFGLHLDIQDDDEGAANVAGWAFHRDPQAMMNEGGGEDGDGLRARGRQLIDVMRVHYAIDKKHGRGMRKWTKPQLSDATGMSTSTTQRELDALEAAGRIAKDGRGWVYVDQDEEGTAQ